MGEKSNLFWYFWNCWSPGNFWAESLQVVGCCWWGRSEENDQTGMSWQKVYSNSNKQSLQLWWAENHLHDLGVLATTAEDHINSESSFSFDLSHQPGVSIHKTITNLMLYVLNSRECCGWKSQISVWCLICTLTEALDPYLYFLSFVCFLHYSVNSRSRRSWGISGYWNSQTSLSGTNSHVIINSTQFLPHFDV